MSQHWKEWTFLPRLQFRSTFQTTVNKSLASPGQLLSSIKDTVYDAEQPCLEAEICQGPLFCGDVHTCAWVKTVVWCWVSESRVGHIARWSQAHGAFWVRDELVDWTNGCTVMRQWVFRFCFVLFRAVLCASAFVWVFCSDESVPSRVNSNAQWFNCTFR